MREYSVGMGLEGGMGFIGGGVRELGNMREGKGMMKQRWGTIKCDERVVKTGVGKGSVERGVGKCEC